MSIRRLQGAALIISAVIGLVGLIGSGIPAVRILFVIGALLLIFGVPAIESVQQAGTLDWLGIALIELAALISLVLNVGSISGASISGSAIPLVSAILGAIGRVLVGWLTTQHDAFMKWVGWAFIGEGILNLVGGFLGGEALGILVSLLGAAALFGYGWGIMQRSGWRASA